MSNGKKIGTTREDELKNELECFDQSLLREGIPSEDKIKKITSALSHEFKTPLSTIKLSASYLLKYWNRLEPTAIEEKLRAIVDQVSNLVFSVDQLVALRTEPEKKIEASKESIHLVEFFIGLISELQEKFPQHRIEFTHQLADPYLVCDKDLLQSLLANILSNALSYSPDHFTVWVQVSETGSAIVIQVRDHGIGIRENDLPKIFDSFYRGSNIGDIKGMGLGLSMARRAADAMNGKIDVSSNVQQGSIFTITIPKSK